MKIKETTFHCIILAMIVATVGCSDEKGPSAAIHLQRAQQALVDNKPIVANIEAKNVLLKDAKSLQARWILAQSYLKLRQGLAAETEVNKLLQANFDAEGLLTGRLEALMLQGKYSEIVTSATKPNPSSGESSMRAAAYIAMADIQHGNQAEKNRRGYLALARSDLSKALEKDPSNQAVYLGLAKLALRSDHFAKAKEYLDKAEQLDGTNAAIWNQRGIIGQVTSDFDYAEENYRRAVELAPYNLLFNLNLARILIALNKGGEALEVLSSQTRSHTRMPTLQYLRALAFVQGGDLEKAADILNGVVKEYPKYIEAQFLLGRLFTDLGQYGQAEVALNTVLEFFPSHTRATELLTNIKAAHNRRPEEKTLKRVLSKDAVLQALLGREQEHLNDAEITLQQQHAAERLIIERQVFLDAPKSTQQQVVLQLSQRGDYQKIIDLALARTQKDGNGAQAADWAGLANMLRGDFDVARQFFNIALKHEPDLLSAINNLADLEFRLQNLDIAEELFRRALARVPEDPTAMLGMARLNIVRGQFNAASDLIESVMTNDEHRLRATYVQAELSAARGETEAWYQTIEQIKTMNADRVEPYLMLARFHVRQNEPDIALRIIADAELNTQGNPELRKSKVHVYAHIGRTALASGELQQAREAFETLLKIQPKNASALNNLAWIYHLERRPEAIDLAERSYDLNPNSVSVMDTLGWILVGHGKFERAAKILAVARERSAGAGDVRYHYAKALHGLGRNREALVELQAALETDNLSARGEAESLLGSLQ